MKMNLLKRLLRSTAANLIAAFLMSGSLGNSAIFLWNNTGSAWTSGTSWTNGVQPSSTSSSTTTDEVQFGNVGANFNTVDLTSSRSVKNLTFLTNANAYTFTTASAKVLTTSAGITNNSTATQTFNLLVENANASNTWYQTSGGTMVFNNLVTLTTSSSSTSRTLTLAGGGTFTFNNSLNQGGLATAGKVVINNAGGTVNLSSANTLGGGMQITAGTVNFSNAGSLGTGILELGATTGTSYGNSILNNSSGSAINLTGITGLIWSGTTPAGIQIGTSASTAANNIDFGSGLVTTTTSRAMNIAGSGVTISMGTLTTTGTSNGYTYTFDGVGNTIDLDGWKISTAVTPIQNVVHQLKGSANLNVGTIENGTAGWVNGIEINGGGINRLTGNNTYTGTTSFLNGTNYISGNNSAATGNVSIAGTSGSGKMPLVRLDSANAISSSSSISGSTSTTTTGTLDFNGATNYIFNAYNGNNMFFTNSFGQYSVVTFTNIANTITASAGTSGGRQLINNSTNLLITFNGNIDIGSSTTGINNTLGGTGDWLVKGNIFSTTAGSVRGLNKTGTGLLELRGLNDYNGDTVMSGGTLLVTSSGSITNSTVQLSGGILDVRGTIGALNQTGGSFDLRGNAGLFGLSTGTATVRSGATLGDSVLNGGLLDVYGTAGAVTVNSNSTINVKNGGVIGTTTVGGGTLLVDGRAGVTTVNSGVSTVNSGGIIGNAVINGSLLSINGTAGNITVNTGGTLGGSGSVGDVLLNGGTLSPGNSPGLLTTSSLDASNGNFIFQLGAPTTRGITYDAIDVTNLLKLGANTTWQFQVDGAYSFQLNDSYDLFNFGSIDTTGFDITALDIALPDLNTSTSDLKWDTSSFTTDGMVSVITNVPEPSAIHLLGIGLISLLACRKINKRNG